MLNIERERNSPSIITMTLNSHQTRLLIEKYHFYLSAIYFGFRVLVKAEAWNSYFKASKRFIIIYPLYTPSHLLGLVQDLVKPINTEKSETSNR